MWTCGYSDDGNHQTPTDTLYSPADMKSGVKWRSLERGWECRLYLSRDDFKNRGDSDRSINLKRQWEIKNYSLCQKIFVQTLSRVYTKKVTVENPLSHIYIYIRPKMTCDTSHLNRSTGFIDKEIVYDPFRVHGARPHITTTSHFWN